MQLLFKFSFLLVEISIFIASVSVLRYGTRHPFIELTHLLVYMTTSVSRKLNLQRCSPSHMRGLAFLFTSAKHLHDRIISIR